MIENHSKQQERQKQDDTTELEQRGEDAQDEVAEDEEEDEEEEEDRAGEATSPEVSFASQSSPFTDGRLVKSHSEAPIGSPKGQSTSLLCVQKFSGFVVNWMPLLLVKKSMKDFLRRTKIYSKLPGPWLFIFMNLYLTTIIVVVILSWGIQILRYSRKY